MARPTKGGMDYFPLDVHLDEKMELIEAEFGLTGFAVVVKLFQKIYGQSGYYCEWNEEVALLFGRRIGLGGSAVSEIVSAAIRRGFFNKGLYDKYQILTSRGVQKRYLEAVSRRTRVSLEEAYLLVDAAELPINVCINHVNVDITSKNVDYNPQSKGKKSKEDNGAAGNAPEQQRQRRFVKPTVDEVSAYCNERGNNINPEAFYDYYEAKGWVVGKSPMKDWKAAIRQWERNTHYSQPHQTNSMPLYAREV